MARSRSRPAPARAPARPAPSSRSVPAPSRSAPAPAPHNHQNAPAHHQPSGGGGLLSGFASTVAQGFAFGTGSAVAHRAVGAAANAMGGSGEQQQGAYQEQPQQGGYMQQQAPINPCQMDAQNFQACISHNAGNVDACSFLFEALQQCQRNGAYAANGQM